MTPERWQRVKSLFERALDQPAEARAALLESAGESPSISDEVRALLAGDAQAGSFLQDAVTNPSIETLPEGALLGGHYRIVSLLGRGGMGVVYRAEDLVLSRPVALKFLVAGRSEAPQALERMKREARAAAALNHPNICVVYEVGEHLGQPFIAMELLEGQTLAERIGARPLKTDELLEWAVEVAGALEAAHSKGIIHRDIKPSNIYITTEGHAKILDFGLAKLAAPPAGAAGVDQQLTSPGVAVGTVPYMSPEQARGQALDSRTDLFSLGAVLYEMATGKPAFTGATTAIVHEAILSQAPPSASTANVKIPEDLDRIIAKALEKDRDLRYQHAADLRADLRRLQRDSGSGGYAPLPAPTARKARRYSRILFRGLLVAAVLLSLGVAWFASRRFAARGTLTARQLTHNTPENRALFGDISPDGRYLAYTDTKGLHLSVIDTGAIHDIPLPEELQTQIWFVRWFPDGENLLLKTFNRSEGHVAWVKSVFSGAPRKLRAHVREAVISSQGSTIAFVSDGSREIWVMGANGENPRKVLTSDKDPFLTLAWSPAGRRLAYVKRSAAESGDFGGAIETVALEGGTPSLVFADPGLVVDEPSLVWLDDGRLLFASREGRGSEHNTNLWSMVADPRTGRPSGRPSKLTNWYGGGAFATSVSRDGSRLVVWRTRNWNDVYVGELKDKGTRLDPPRRLTMSDTRDLADAWTPDSRAVVFESDRAGATQIFRQPLDGDKADPLLQKSENQRDARFSPDGAWILYWATADGDGSSPASRRLMRLPASGGSPEQVLEAPAPQRVFFDCPSRPDGSCVFSRWDRGEVVFTALDPLHGLGKQLARTDGSFPWAVSPDGTRIAYASATGPRAIDLRDGAVRSLHPPMGITSLSWAADGAALFATVGYSIVRLELNGKTRVLFDSWRDHYIENVRASPNGRYLAFSRQTFESNIWLLQNF